MTDPLARASKPAAPNGRGKWKRRGACAGLVYIVACLAVWAMAETDYRRVLAGGKPRFAHERAAYADGGSVDYWGPGCSYLLEAVHSYADPRPEWAHSDGWAYDDGATVSYPIHFLPLNAFAKQSIRIVPGGYPIPERQSLFLEMESWERIYVYDPDLPEAPRPQAATRAEADKLIERLQPGLLKAAQVTLTGSLVGNGRKVEATTHQIQSWLAGHGISRIVFRTPRDGGTSVLREVGAVQEAKGE